MRLEGSVQGVLPCPGWLGPGMVLTSWKVGGWSWLSPELVCQATSTPWQKSGAHCSTRTSRAWKGLLGCIASSFAFLISFLCSVPTDWLSPHIQPYPLLWVYWRGVWVVNDSFQIPLARRQVGKLHWFSCQPRAYGAETEGIYGEVIDMRSILEEAEKALLQKKCL